MGKITEKIKQTISGIKDSAERKTTDPLNEYESNEPMTPAKIQEHEPTAVKREMTENITEPGRTGTNPEEAAEKLKSGMTKGTAGGGETGNEYQ